MQRMVLDAILLEFEGVLADTTAPRRDAITSVLEDEGIFLSESEYRGACAGRSTADAVRAVIALRRLAFDETATDLLALRIERAFSAHLSKGVVLVDGAREVVERLAARTRLGIVSRASRRDIEFIISLARLDHAFMCIIGAEDAYPPKPSPAPYLAALRRLERKRSAPEHRVVVALEDAQDGIRAAAAAGLRCVAIGELPAHVAMEAEALLPAVTGLDAEMLERLVARDDETFA
ncbi:MAG: HAD family phosphatase [Gemmatimonadaceae bacterium]